MLYNRPTMEFTPRWVYVDCHRCARHQRLQPTPPMWVGALVAVSGYTY
jgi:hypothetical protein